MNWNESIKSTIGNGLRVLPSRRWSDLVRAGLLRGLPQDPNGAVYNSCLDGTVQVQDPTKFIYLDRHGKPP